MCTKIIRFIQGVPYSMPDLLMHEMADQIRIMGDPVCMHIDDIHTYLYLHILYDICVEITVLNSLA